MYDLPVCSLVCCWTWLSCLNLLSQYVHLYGFSPVWTRICCTNWWFELKDLRHCWHWCGLLDSRPPEMELPPPTLPARCICICIADLCMKIWGKSENRGILVVTFLIWFNLFVPMYAAMYLVEEKATRLPDYKMVMLKV